jgi:hypothetical protein
MHRNLETLGMGASVCIYRRFLAASLVIPGTTHSCANGQNTFIYLPVLGSGQFDQLSPCDGATMYLMNAMGHRMITGTKPILNQILGHYVGRLAIFSGAGVNLIPGRQPAKTTIVTIVRPNYIIIKAF